MVFPKVFRVDMKTDGQTENIYMFYNYGFYLRFVEAMWLNL